MRRHTCVGGCTIYRNLVLCQSDISCVQNSEQQMRKNKCQWWKVSQNTGVIPIANSRSALRKQMHAYHLTISKKTKKTQSTSESGRNKPCKICRPRPQEYRHSLISLYPKWRFEHYLRSREKSEHGMQSAPVSVVVRAVWNKNGNIKHVGDQTWPKSTRFPHSRTERNCSGTPCECKNVLLANYSWL